MPEILRDRFVLAWLFLVAVTLFSSAIGGVGGIPLADSKAAVTVTVLGIAFAKVWVVMDSFMDVRGAPWLLRAACMGWLVVVLAVLLAIYGGVIP